MAIKHALITGGAKRIGRVIALHLAKAGWDISLHYHSSKDEAEALAEEIKRIGRKVQILRSDFEDLNSVGCLLPENPSHPITAIIHNASLFLHDDKDLDGSRHIIVNYESPMVLSHKFAQQLPDGEHGSIIHFLDNTEMPDFLRGYSRSREMLRGKLSGIAKHYAPNITVNAMALGPTEKNERESDKHFQALIENTPLGRQTDVHDVAATALLLMHTKSITGQIINVDSGMHLIL